MKTRISIIILSIYLWIAIPVYGEVRNVIFIIGDGMGLAQIQAASTQKGAPLVMEQMPYSALQRTYSANNYITDSAAGGTALACGEKTNNYAIGVTPDGTPIESILTLAHNNGRATGIVTTCDITHATPAAYYAHSLSRNNTQEIAAYLPESGIDVVIAGGRKVMQQRQDGRNLVQEMQQAGYAYASTLEEARNAAGDRLLALVAEEHPAAITEGRGEYLSEAVTLALQRLKNNKKGFFLLIEGSQIDWGGHNNDAAYNIGEVLDLDKAIAIAFDFARKEGNTLVVVTADHETGGTVLLNGDIAAHTTALCYTSKNHTGAYVPLFASGKEAAGYRGVIENTLHKEYLRSVMGLKKSKTK